MVTGQALSHSGAEEYPREKHEQKQRWYTHTSQLTQFMPPPETYKSEIGSQPTTCQVHTGAYVSLLAPGNPTIYTACHPRKTTTYILHVVPITSLRLRTTDASQLEKRNKEKEEKIRGRKENTRQEEEARKRKREK